MKRQRPLGFLLGGAIATVVVLLVVTQRKAPDSPIVRYDWSTFTENKRLSEDFTRAVREVFEPGHTESNPHWLRMKQEVFAEIEYLGFEEMTVNLLHGFKHRRYLGYSVKRRNGSVVEGWSTANEHYLFPMVVVFQPDGSLVVKTNGEEKKFDYNASKAMFKEHFTNTLYIALSREFEKTFKFSQRKAQREEDARQREAQQLEKNRRSWE